MRPFASYCLLFPLLFCPATKERDWQAGRVTADSSIRSSAYNEPAQHTAADPHILLIQSADSLYTAREKHPWTGWCLLLQGDDIKYAVDGHRLFVIDAEGQKCQLDILSQQKSPAH